MRSLIVICIAMLMVVCATQAFAEVQNVKVSGDLGATLISRSDFDLGSVYNTGWGTKDSNVIMSQTRLRVDADLTDNVSTAIRLINERDWTQEANAVNSDTAVNNQVAIDLAYVTLKEMLYAPLTVTIGRQDLHYGNGMIIGDVDTNRTTAADYGIANRDLSLRKSFDAIKATLDYSPLMVDLVYSKINENSRTSRPEKDNVDLVGLNATYDLGDDYKTSAETYFWYKQDQSLVNDGTGAVESANNKADVIYCPGLKVSTNPIERLSMGAELAWQLGTKDLGDHSPESRARQAMAAQFMGTYALDMKMSPVLGIVYSWFSGDDNAGATNVGNAAAWKDTYKAWDPMFEDQTAGRIINVLFQQTDSKVLNLKGSLKPLEDVTLSIDYIELWLAKALNTGKYGVQSAQLFTLYGINGASSTPIMHDSKHLGSEVDLTLAYDYTEDVKFSLMCDWFVPGNAFADENSKNASELLASCKVLF